MIYVIGHKSPDLDSVVSAVAYAELKNKLISSMEYTAAAAGEFNKETEYIFDKFGINLPQKVENIAGNKVVLVDHNEESQSADGRSEAEIVEVLDHHKIDFKYDQPIKFRTYPYGATASIIANEYLTKGIDMDKNMASLLLSAILVDTVITKSPTCTSFDKALIGRLAEISGIADWKEFGLEIFKVRGAVSEMSAAEIINSDFKDFEFKSGKFGIGQIETVDLTEFDSRIEELKEELKKIKDNGSYHSLIIFITDIMKEGSKFLVITDDEEKMTEALGKPLSGDIYLDGVMSRKKQVVPMMSEKFDK